MNQKIISDCIYYENQRTKEGLSLVTAVMNRSSNLIDVLKTWLAISEIDEFIILDWSSDYPVYNLLKPLSDSRIKIVRVENEPKWILSHALNLAIRFSNFSVVLKVDADIRIHRDFFKVHNLGKSTFLAGNYKNARNDNERFLNGSFVIKRSDFFKSGAFNEYITFYGYDDEDLYNRLQQLGLNRMDISNDHMFHIPHEERHVNQDVTWKGMCLSDKEVTIMKNLCNQMLVKHLINWSSNNLMREFTIINDCKDYIRCATTNTETNILPAEVMENAEILAIRHRLKNAAPESHRHFIDKMSSSHIIDAYKTIFSRDTKSKICGFIDFYSNAIGAL